MTLNPRTLRSFRRGRRPRFRGFFATYAELGNTERYPLTPAVIEEAALFAERRSNELHARGAHWDSTGPIQEPLSLAEARQGLRDTRAVMETLSGTEVLWGRTSDLDRRAMSVFARLQLLEDIYRAWIEDAEADALGSHGAGERFTRARSLRSRLDAHSISGIEIGQRRGARALPPRSPARAHTLVMSPRAPGATRLCVA